jgi:hypothetical protein
MSVYEVRRTVLHTFAISLSVAILVFIAVVVLDVIYVLYSAAVASGRRMMAATSSMVLHLTSALVIIIYTKSAGYLAIVAAGSWVGTYIAMLWTGKTITRPVAAQRATPRTQPQPASPTPSRIGAPVQSK